ncbi:hypothetical protein [Lunatibacter salilacus]|uniref:hypothetical protein n=1 Tax=Lunatibacter salilacus TaxID=2483804 RepID=UPI00131C92F1|nr:hypothetical protein [Lunatibacter salilacus]
MKILKTYFLVCLCFITSFSCTTKKAVVGSESNYKEGAITLEPKWERRNTGVWIVAPLVGAGIGGAYGYNSEVFEGLENQEQNVLAFGGAGLVGGLLIAGAVRNNSLRKKPVSAKPNEYTTWTKKYNRKNGTNYSFLREVKGGHILLTPEKLTEELDRFQSEYQDVISSLNNNPSVNWDMLDRYRRFGQDKSFEFFPEQRVELTRLIAQREPKAAYATLSEKMEQIVRKPLDLENVLLLSYLKQNNRALYAKLSTAQQNSLQQMADAYASRIFTAHFEKIRNASLQSLDKKDLASAQRIDEVYNLLTNQTRGFSQLQVVDEMFAYIRELKGEVVSENETKIAAYFQRLNTNSQLTAARSQYLDNTDQRPVVQRLNSLAETVSSQILAEAERREAEQARQAREREIAKFQTLMNQTTPTGEPTEEQMRFAIQMQVDFKNQELGNLANAEYDRDNPMSAFSALIGTFVKGTEHYLEYFRKIACEKSAGRGGYVCDYSLKRNVKGGVSGNMANSMISQLGAGLATIETGRFVKNEGIWMVVEIKK